MRDRPGGSTDTSSGATGERDEGEFVIEEYQGTVTLTADFADGTIRGCIGCVGDLVSQRAHFGVFLGDELMRHRGPSPRTTSSTSPPQYLREDGMFERDRESR